MMQRLHHKQDGPASARNAPGPCVTPHPQRQEHHMTTTTTGGRALAIAAGMAFTGGALYILLEDAIKNLHWTMAHGLAVLTVFGVIASMHLAGEAWRSRHFGTALGFVLVALIGTGLVVYNSVGRQAEANDTSVLSA